jgi:hypothetical protein
MSEASVATAPETAEYAGWKKRVTVFLVGQTISTFGSFLGSIRVDVAPDPDHKVWNRLGAGCRVRVLASRQSFRSLPAFGPTE